jgi:cation diffusion facilitator CzcD-associated flavoprotein CzcO
VYSFSFAPSPDWSHTFARQPEIQSYLRKMFADTGIRDRILTGCELLEASWDDAAGTWRVLPRGDRTLSLPGEAALSSYSAHAEDRSGGHLHRS